MTTAELVEFFYPPTDFQKELLKLAIQFVGALFIAKLTVRWALARFKTEKMWERQTTALADVLSSLSELDRIYDSLLYQYMMQREHDAQSLNRRADEAMKKFLGVAGVAALLLPKNFAGIIARLEVKLGERPDDYFNYLEQRSGAINCAINELTAELDKYRGLRSLGGRF